MSAHLIRRKPFLLGISSFLARDLWLRPNGQGISFILPPSLVFLTLFPLCPEELLGPIYSRLNVPFEQCPFSYYSQRLSVRSPVWFYDRGQQWSITLTQTPLFTSFCICSPYLKKARGYLYSSETSNSIFVTYLLSCSGILVWYWDSYLALFFFCLCSMVIPMVTRETQFISLVHYLFNQIKWIKCLKSTIVVSRKLHDEQGSRRQEQAKAKLKECREPPILFTSLVWDRTSLGIIYTSMYSSWSNCYL